MDFPNKLRIEVASKDSDDFRKLYLIGCQEEDSLSRIKDNFLDLFYDHVIERVIIDGDEVSGNITEVTFLPGVTDNEARSAKEALELVGVKAEVFSGAIYLNSFKNEDANPLIQNIENKNKLSSDRFKNISLPLVQLDHELKADKINLDISDEELLKLSDERCLALTLDELLTIKNYYLKQDSMPTDVELEVLAQTWSEHCKHKIFAAEIEYNESESHEYKKVESKTIKSLYKTYVKNATKKIEQDNGIDWLISVFSDNAGIVRFDKNIDLCIKVETHNSPSALDPYGGALTGILGVNRDILGTGMGAKPIANTNVFCVGPYTWPNDDKDKYMPKGLMNPADILYGVHRGVVDGGNKSGIPTINGAMAFDACFAGKPLVYCGTVGSLPPKLASGKDSGKKYASPGDHIIIVGGSVGADGIHGATFSSKELDESPPATAVQIGDPITQKRVGDFLMEARELELYTSITDNGAGGLSSSVGEMAEATNGARIDLSKCPLKYPGLAPWEVMISESQERMTLAVDKNNLNKITSLAAKRNVQLVDIGEFTNDGFFHVFWGENEVAKLELEFMHNGLPPMKLKANWDGPRPIKEWMPTEDKTDSKDIFSSLCTILADENIASKKHWVKQYDHEVQASTVVRPFIGKDQKTPNDSGVIALETQGGEKDNAIAVACGMAYQISHEDPYLMAIYALDEAVRNCLSQGADPNYICLLDNFCWPDPIETEKNPEGAYKLGQLVRTCEGLYDAAVTYKMPLVSGKDSMKNDFKGRNRAGDPLTISIEPTLLVTAMAKTNLNNIISSEFKKEGDLIYLISASKHNLSLNNSVYAKYFKTDEKPLETPNLKENIDFYQSFYQFNKQFGFSSAHDVSEGGALVSITESIFSGLGAKLKAFESELFFNEVPAQFVVSIDQTKKAEFENSFKNITLLGEVVADSVLIIGDKSYSVNEAFNAWQGPWGKVYE